MHQPDFITSPPPASPSASSSTAPPPWNPYVNYTSGTVVWYGGTFWRCENGHTSGAEPAGAPTNNLHIWTPVGSSNGAHPQQGFYVQQPQAYYGQPPSYSPQPTQAYNQGYYNAPSASSQLYAPVPTYPTGVSGSRFDTKDDSPSSGETITTPYNEKKGFEQSSSASAFLTTKAKESLRYITIREETHRAQNKDEIKDELKGKRVWRVGGIGMWAYSLDANEEEMKKKVWRDWGEKHGKDDWLKASRERTEFYVKESRGVKPLFTWKLVERNQRLPADVLPIGNEQDGTPLYAARAWWEGGIHLGKAGHHLQNGASISYGGDEITLDTYEVFCGPINEPYLVKWMTFRHGEVVNVNGWQPVEAGREKDGAALLLAKGEYENGQHPGKCLINDDHACVGYGGGELWVRPFQILAYANPDRR
ncbi:hypothetical protein CI109_105141 [Kwoniella shandongensis]|uniref:Uncharacterized protein n=1 Tax=Kwoniella shandongensis TaxID=1734106 RepID=A0A5M6C7Y2_9TREE|nr:uncharacterized protein CI109_001980 [Kwoniella shandongensis]KAA5529555.1 hypothetical protein CI109_001980 [Kwoniella shandongensis]